MLLSILQNLITKEPPGLEVENPCPAKEPAFLTLEID